MFIFDVLIAYLYVLCAIYFVYVPVKRILLNKLEMLELVPRSGPVSP